MKLPFLFATLLVCAGFTIGWVSRPLAPGAAAGTGLGRSTVAGTHGGNGGTSSASAQSAQVERQSGEHVNELPVERITEQIRGILKEKDPLRRTSTFHSMLAAADLGGLRKISEALSTCYNEGLPTRLLGEEAGRREGWMMGRDGMDAMPSEPNGEPSYLMKHRMRGWSTANPVETKAWLAELEEGRAKQELTREWESGISGAEAGKLLELLPEVSPDHQQRLIGKVVEAAVLENGLEGMADWYKKAEAILPDSSKQQAFRHLVDSFTQGASTWTQAVDFLKAASAPDQQLFAEGLQQTVWRGARYDPKQSLQLLEEYLPQNTYLQEGRADYISQCINASSTVTVGSIGEWLNSNKEAAIYNDVAVALTHHIREIDPTGAKAWAESITDQVLREQLLSELTSVPQ